MDSQAQLDELLVPSKLNLLDSPRVLKTLHEPYIDSLGLEGVRVWVISSSRRLIVAPRARGRTPYARGRP